MLRLPVFSDAHAEQPAIENAAHNTQSQNQEEGENKPEPPDGHRVVPSRHAFLQTGKPPDDRSYLVVSIRADWLILSGFRCTRRQLDF